MTHRLLILACSQAKLSDPGLLPAIERYDGPPFRLLRKFQRECPNQSEEVDVYILSAKFGLIKAYTDIPLYDQYMTSQRALELKPVLEAQLKSVTEQRDYTEALISLGKVYKLALPTFDKFNLGRIKVTVTNGTQGRKLSILHDWLYGTIPLHAPMKRPGIISIRGVPVNLTQEMIIELVRQKLNQHPSDAYTYQSWYIEIDNRKIAPKWLINQITNLSVSSFNTSDAIRALARLGFEVKRV
ncbi:MAG: hypothetical protein R3C14_03135 [Caldilineaceae bacterium]